MRFSTPLVSAVLIRRYKRFLADCRLSDGREVTAHCANPGSMLGLSQPGTKIWLEPNDDPKKKLRFGWRLVEHQNGHFTCVDTLVANRVLREAIQSHAVSGLPSYETVRPEVKYGDNSRIDFLLCGKTVDTYVEVKSVTLSRASGLAEFPDSVTARGAKHLAELGSVAAKGQCAVMLYLVQRTDAERVTLAGDIDPTYFQAFRRARAAGVQVLALGAKISPEGVWIGDPLPFEV